jgi:hypothetical protein
LAAFDLAIREARILTPIWEPSDASRTLGGVGIKATAEAGADVIVAQGTEGGGHGMSEPLFTLLPQVVDACPGVLWSRPAGSPMDVAWLRC